MYDELVKSLRQCAEASCAGCKNDLVQIGCRGLLQHEAADVIEDLQRKLQKSEADNVNLTGWLAEEHAKHLWIPVTERLPECDLGAEVGNIEWISCGMVHSGCFGRGGKYRDAYFRTWTDAGEGMDAKDADYWRAVTLPEPPKEET